MKFEMNPAVSKSLFNELNELLRKKISQLLPTPQNMRGDEREDFRIIFSKEARVSMQLPSTETVPAQNIKGVLVDLSLGGACLALRTDNMISPGTLGDLRLDFLSNPLKLKMTVLDSRMKTEP
ncbi:MAG: PilZ domain-containing protein [Oligoflexales bacterium]|nr:PilZ domain-containing protein [Oligoflexales bacterium]